MSKLNKVQITYSRPTGYAATYRIVESVVAVEPHMVDRTVEAINSGRDSAVVSMVEVPWCGWVNTWTDSGDRGAAHADHMRTCSVCVD